MYYPLDEKWEIDRQCLIIKEQIGAGAFGVVNRATGFGLPGLPQQCTVAVKMLKGGYNYIVDSLGCINSLQNS